jgi:hypothetical protein
MCDNRRNPKYGFAIIEGKGVLPIRFSQWKMTEQREERKLMVFTGHWSEDQSIERCRDSASNVQRAILSDFLKMVMVQYPRFGQIDD